MQTKCKRNLQKSSKLREFRQSNFELSFQTKMRRNFGTSIILMSARFSQTMWWIEKKFRGMRRNFVGKFRAGRTKFRFAETKYRFDETKFLSGGAKFRLSRIGSWLQNAAVIITSCKRTCTCKHDHYLKKKHVYKCIKTRVTENEFKFCF